MARLAGLTAGAIAAVALAGACGGSHPNNAGRGDGGQDVQSASSGDASDAVMALCRFKCQTDMDCCARLGLGAGCPTTYPNRATCNPPAGMCEWHWNCEQDSECQTAKGAAYACVFQPGTTQHGFCRKPCTTADDCAGEATLYDPAGQTCMGGRCYGNGMPAVDAGFHGVDPPPPAPPCKTDQDCANSRGNPPVGSTPGGMRCQTSTGRCLGCIADGDCAGDPGGKACNTMAGWCGCRNDSSCAPDLVCGY